MGEREWVALNVNWVNALLPTGMRLRGQLLRAVLIVYVLPQLLCRPPSLGHFLAV